MIGIVRKSLCPYVPLNVECEIGLNERGLVNSVHRIDNGAGTYLSKWDNRHLVWEAVN